MRYHRIKITIIMEQRQSLHDTEGSDNHIDLAEWESAEQLFGSFAVLIRFETLEDLCED